MPQRAPCRLGHFCDSARRQAKTQASDSRQTANDRPRHGYTPPDKRQNETQAYAPTKRQTKTQASDSARRQAKTRLYAPRQTAERDASIRSHQTTDQDASVRFRQTAGRDASVRSLRMGDRANQIILYLSRKVGRNVRPTGMRCCWKGLLSFICVLPMSLTCCRLTMYD